MRSIGLTNIGNEGRVWVMEAGAPSTRWFKLSLGRLRPRLVDSGLLADTEVSHAMNLFDDPRWSAYTPIILAAWGQRPVSPAA
jgi:hypothetical protein